jgi:predicted ATP-grasp superfamily ATP-dependent carboligase
MKILLSEYATSTGMGGTYLIEGKAMLECLTYSFYNAGHEVVYTSSDVTIGHGTKTGSNEGNLKTILELLSMECDAALLIAPDDLLAGLTGIIEKNTLNLGSESAAIGKCADKLECSRILEKNAIPVPKTLTNGEEMEKGTEYVVKPRFGCAAEDTVITRNPVLGEGHIATEYIEGEHLSVSLVCAGSVLPLAVNKQIIETGKMGEDIAIDYRGSMTPYHPPYEKELIETATQACKVLGCRGYAGVDIVMADKPYVVDVNPRPTTSLTGIARLLRTPVAELLLLAAEDRLPKSVELEGSIAFTKEDLI